LEVSAPVGFIQKESVTMHGHKIVKFIQNYANRLRYFVPRQAELVTKSVKKEI